MPDLKLSKNISLQENVDSVYMNVAGKSKIN